MRHLQEEHNPRRPIEPVKGFVCAVEVCWGNEKMWLHQDQYRSHCRSKHPFDDYVDLVKKSTIYL